MFGSLLGENMTFAILRQRGIDFFDFLKESDRGSLTDKEQLKVIYNQEFRRRPEITWIKKGNFSSVIYALKSSYKIRRRGDEILFNSTVRKRPLVSQWSRSRAQEQPPVQPEEASPQIAQEAVAAAESEKSSMTPRKRANRLLKLLKTDNTLYDGKNGIEIISSDNPFEKGKLSLDVEIIEMSLCLTVKNTGATSVYFTCYSALRWLKAFTFVDEEKVTRVKPLLLNPGDNYDIQVGIHCTDVGCFSTTLSFEFKADLQPSSASFLIMRDIVANCITALGRELKPVAPYKPLPFTVFTELFDFTIVDGQRPVGVFGTKLKYKVPIKPYRIPLDMHVLIKALKQSTHHSKRTVLESPLSWDNYSSKFSALLYLEELQLEVDIRRYNIPNDRQGPTVMTKDPCNKKHLLLEVQGVSENRPSVLRGDELIVWPENSEKEKYRVYVHSVLLDRISLGYNAKLLNNFIDEMKFNVEFTINRLTLRIQHRAAELAVENNLRCVLFPAESSSSGQNSVLPRLTLFNQLLERNPEQYQAIQHIVAGSSRPAPYLLFGPPGTGKTVTMVEAIKQVEKTQMNCHILACAPSNSAADLLCKRILEQHVDKHKVYRIYASCLDPRMVPEELKKCSNLEGDSFSYPDKETLMSYRIIVSTMMTAGRLVSGGIPPGHFTHMFLDEAGHAVETECLIPLAGLLNPESGQVVLAGDHKQLGPIVRSPFTLQYGMGVSFLERLMCNFSLYQKQNGIFDNRYVTKLLRNYRSHPAILKIPNELFYDGELQVCADEMLRNSFCGWEHLADKAKNFPVIFHGVTGVDQREASSPSFFNVAEVEVLMDYVKKLMQLNGKKGKGILSPRDIGIIAPYRKQVQKIRKGLEKVGKDLRLNNMNDVKVGSVEEFQGQERRVIMVSTVRSSTDYLQIDKKFHLGFVKNEKRFNVAVTRAKALLIVVGNPRVLNSDPTWARFIQYCSDEGGYIPIEMEDEDTFIGRLTALSITIERQVEESDAQLHLELEWKKEM